MQSETVIGGFLTAALGLGLFVVGAVAMLTAPRRTDLIGWGGAMLLGVGVTLVAVGFSVAGGGA
jgi:hypothetical protein